MDPSAKDDKLPGEAELAALYRQLPRNEPGPALDAVVLRAAAQALEDSDDHAETERRKKPRESGDWVHPKPLSGIAGRAIPSIDSAARARRRRVPHWLVGLSSAASLVLVAGLAWHMRTTTTEEPAQANLATSSPQASAAPTQARRPTDTTNTKPADDAFNQAKRHAVVSDTMGSVAPSAVSELSAAPPPARIQSPLRSTESTSNKARAARSNAHVAPMAVPMAVPMTPPPAPPLHEISAQLVTAPPPAPAAPPSPAVVTQATTHTVVDATDTPAQELDKIEQLFKQGHDDEAHQRLRDFRQAHPRWPLPPVLQAQLPKS